MRTRSEERLSLMVSRSAISLLLSPCATSSKCHPVPKRFTVLDTAAGEVDHAYPDVLPNGKGLLFTVGLRNAPESWRDYLYWNVELDDT